MKMLRKQLIPDYKKYPEKVLQFGSGNFLRAFVDWQIDQMNQKADFHGSVVITQSTGSGTVDKLNEQDGLFTVCIQGCENGRVIEKQSVVTCVQRGIAISESYQEFLQTAQTPSLRFVVSNTTEAGIRFEKEALGNQPPKTFPGKLTVFLYERYKAFQGDDSKGLVIIPCELIERNGEVLKQTVLRYAKSWHLENGFVRWIYDANTFCSSLVDRIVPGFPQEKFSEMTAKLGYHDQLLVMAEPYYLWVIEGPASLREELPFEKAGLNVLLVDDMTPYRTLKVRILNGVHTAIAAVAYLHGCRTVGEAVRDQLIKEYIDKLIFGEIVPTLDLPEEEAKTYARSVLERFENPFIHHHLTSISLNALSKFRTRNLPAILDYFERFGTLPNCLVFALSSLISYYKGEKGNEAIPLNDDEEAIELFSSLWRRYDGSDTSLAFIVKHVLAAKKIWQMDLNVIPGLADLAASFLTAIEHEGMESAVKRVTKKGESE